MKIKANLKQVTIGSIWSSGEKSFKVLNLVTIDNKKWVFYKSLSEDNDFQEYSCYEEAFKARFLEVLT